MFKIATRISVFTLALAGFYAQARAQTDSTAPAERMRTSAMVGLAGGQMGEINALNPAEANSTTATACTGTIAFVGDDGTVLKSEVVSVAPGTASHLTLDSVADLSLTAAQRKSIRATLLLGATSTSASASACRLIGSLEIFNTDNGHSQVTLGIDHRVAVPATTTSSSQ